jgi:predicted ATPase
MPVRQQTLRDTIDWSYELLSTGEQRLFALLSVSPSCTFEAVAAVASRWLAGSSAWMRQGWTFSMDWVPWWIRA